MPDERRVDLRHLTLVVRTWAAGRERHGPAVLLPATGETAGDWDLVAVLH